MPKPALLTGAFALLLLGAPARAETGPPELNIEKTCRSAASASVSDNASQEGCLRSERASHDEVKRRWNEFTPAAKRQCEKQFEAGGFPSYVEMVTCLELASGTGLPRQADDARAGQGTSSATKEPSPAQRTDPIKVLEKQ
ncbi:MULTISPECIES: hypothetical protein [unclassified Methylobacterium]|uniref:hypothetical protein n=1 Tax=unclassified Methylobacterium TaxID=2615210 RepID=UPI0006F90E0B|nr:MULTISPECIES: hypothetical protein [unclassified Methylobacterium]KQP77633.1 hypothetical protein ASF60_06575 [Methylobacterium sp. Leaf113]KQP83155.1 hypothetical protein ASF57_13805 [Methylobacterium sp. Leaf117]MCK2055001.1 hypothetical protein [Methylobacterium sp. 37f]